MPESPEIQAHAERMSAALTGKTLTAFNLLNFASLKTFAPSVEEAFGRKVLQVSRHGKHLAINFEGDLSHIVHLMQGGRLRLDTKRSKKPRFGLARWVFDDDTAWLLTEAGTERKAGIWVVDGDPSQQEPLLGLGPEATELTQDQLSELLSGHSKRIHGLLRSQRIMTGLGRMLANEICFAARLSPFANASKLSEEEVQRLHTAIIEVTQAAIQQERTLDDIGKSADRPSKVHNRSGERCSDCDDTIRTVEYRKYTVYYCPTRQTNGKTLADNTTSKFLK